MEPRLAVLVETEVPQVEFLVEVVLEDELIQDGEVLEEKTRAQLIFPDCSEEFREDDIGFFLVGGGLFLVVLLVLLFCDMSDSRWGDEKKLFDLGGIGVSKCVLGNQVGSEGVSAEVKFR